VVGIVVASLTLAAVATVVSVMAVRAYYYAAHQATLANLETVKSVEAAGAWRAKVDAYRDANNSLHDQLVKAVDANREWRDAYERLSDEIDGDDWDEGDEDGDEDMGVSDGDSDNVVTVALCPHGSPLRGIDEVPTCPDCQLEIENIQRPPAHDRLWLRSEGIEWN
jgi:hypothetical protein